VTEHGIAQADSGQPGRPGGRVMRLLVRPTPPPLWQGFNRRCGIDRRRDRCCCRAQTLCSDHGIRHGVLARRTAGRNVLGVRISGDHRTGERRRVRRLPKLAGRLRCDPVAELGGDCSLFRRGAVGQQSCGAGPRKRHRSRPSPTRSRSRRTAADRAAPGSDVGGAQCSAI